MRQAQLAFERETTDERIDAMIRASIRERRSVSAAHSDQLHAAVESRCEWWEERDGVVLFVGLEPRGRWEIQLVIGSDREGSW